MIIIANNPVEASAIGEYPRGSVESSIITTLSESTERYQYDSIDQLKFELQLRKEIINAANALYGSRLAFQVFRKSTCNPAFWDRTVDGGFELKSGVKPSDAINDIFINSSMYGTECATALMIVYYKAILTVYGEALFNKEFQTIHLMNWHKLDKLLREIGIMDKEKDYLPGDRRYFKNPDVDPLTPEWQGENVIDMGHEVYYGHGIGKYDAQTIIAALNENRKADADESAYLMDSAGRPNFKNLSNIYYQSTGAL